MLKNLRFKLKYKPFVLTVATTCFLNCALATEMARSQGLDKRISIVVEKKTLKETLDQISKLAQVGIIYSNAKGILKNPVTIHAKDQLVSKVLSELLSPFNFTYEIIGDQIVVKFDNTSSRPPSKAQLEKQRFPVKGKVTDINGSPLPGATIKIKDGQTLATTDRNGEFEINNVADSTVLQVSFIGYLTKDITVTNGDYLTVTLENGSAQLSEVSIISTGYQTIPKERATGSFEHVSNEQINRKTGTDILSRLDGYTSILFDKRNTTANLQIRGLSTLTQAISQPLIILDNFPYQGDINDINPNDVADITLLKDAAAASIWGARAANGVIVINTKKGSFNKPVQISVNSNISITGKPNLFDVPIISSSDYIDLEVQLFNKGAFDNKISDTYGYPALTPVQEILYNRRQGLISKADSVSQINALRNNDVRNDFLKYVYRTQVQQQHQVDVSGGTNSANYRVSAGYDKNLYSLVGNDYSRYTFNSYTTIRPIKILQMQAGIQYVQTNTTNNSIGNFGSDAYGLFNSIEPSAGTQLPIYSKLADANGNHLSINKYRQSYLDTVGHGALLNWNDKPLDDLNANDNKTVTRMFLADFALRLSPFRYLNFDLKYRYQRSAASINDNYTLGNYYTRDLINQFTNLTATDPNQRNPIPVGGILKSNETEIVTNDLRGQLNFDKNISEKSRLTAIAGFETSQTNNSSADQISYGYSNRLNVSSVDFVNLYPRLLGGSSSIPYPVSYGQLDNRFVSVYANAAYTYANKYTVTGSVRNDATNLYGVDIRNKWKPLYSIGASWLLSNEKFYHSDILTLVKFRATYGYQGNTNNTGTGYTVISYIPANNNFPLNIPAASVFQPGNPQLTWESVRQVNFATDYELWNGKITGSLEYYTKKSTNVLASTDADPTTGYSSVIRNSANISGEGFEIAINSKNITSDIFKWQTSLLFNHATYKVTKYLVSASNNGITSDGAIITPLEGYSPYAIISYRFAGLDPSNGDPIGYVNGVKSKDWDNIVYNTPITQQDIKGSALPLYYGNLYNSFQIGRVQLGVNLVYKFDYFFRRQTINYGILYASGYANSDYLKRWQKPGDENVTNIPSMVYPNPTTSRDQFYDFSDATVEKGDNIKLQTAQISYDLAGLVPPSIGFKQIQIFSNIDNMNLIIWRANKKGIDPDFPLGLKVRPTFSFGLRATL